MQRTRLAAPVRSTRLFCLTVLAVVALAAVSYFPLAKIRAANVGATILPSSGTPLVNLKGARNVKVTYTGSADAVAALQGGTAIPTALASADFDADGAMDVVAGYSTRNGGVLAAGNLIAVGIAAPLVHVLCVTAGTCLPVRSVCAAPESASEPRAIVTTASARTWMTNVKLLQSGWARVPKPATLCA